MVCDVIAPDFGEKCRDTAAASLLLLGGQRRGGGSVVQGGLLLTLRIQVLARVEHLIVYRRQSRFDVTGKKFQRL